MGAEPGARVAVSNAPPQGGHGPAQDSPPCLPRVYSRPD